MAGALIAGYARSPLTLASKGALKRIRPDDLAAAVIKGLMNRTGIDPNTLEDLIVGCAFPEGEQGLNVARNIGFLADLPNSVAGTTVNRFCGSSMQAIHMAVGAIATGAGDAFLCAGIESMSRVPMAGFNPMLNPKLVDVGHAAYMGMGETAENLAKRYDINRDKQDAFAVESHKRAAEAQQKGRFNDEIVPIETRDGIVDQDGCIRPETTTQILADLKPAFEENGSITAGTSSPLTDGSAAVLVTSEDYANTHDLKPLARIKSIAVAGCAPEIMGIGPVNSTNKALGRAGLTLKDIDVIELNEAFAAQSLAVSHDLDLDLNKTNIDGGAIALGHPLGATGARITGKAAQIMKREGKRYALATQCIGGGQGIATVLETM
ncbi:MAG: thiolase family protein [Rhodospirillaceae bacterium]